MSASQPTATSLDALLRAVDRPDAGWDQDDPGVILAHQLDAPLVHDLPTLDDVSDADVTQWSMDAGPAVASFGQLLALDHPPRDLLEATKRYFKPSAARPGGPVPYEVALVMYYAAIAAALRANQPPLSSLGPDKLRHGFAWARQQPWLSGPLPELFAAALALVPDDDAPDA